MVRCAQLPIFALIVAACAEPNLGEDPNAPTGDEDPAAAGVKRDAEPTPNPLFDASTPATDASPRTGEPSCNTAAPFGTPTLLPGLDPTAFYNKPSLSDDELTLYFTTLVDAKAKMMMAKRASRTLPFANSTMMTAQNSIASENDPVESADRLTLWFQSDRGGNSDIYFATRGSTAADFGAPAPVAGVNNASVDCHPFYFSGPTKAELWFTSNRTGNFDVFVAQRAAAGFTFDAPVRVTSLSSDADEYHPALIADGLTILFASTRMGGKGKSDLWMAHRPALTEAFGAPAPVAELNSPSEEHGGWLSADGCRVYFSSDRAVALRQQLYIAERPR